MMVDELPRQAVEIEMLLSAEAVGRQLDVEPETVRRWSREGKFLPAIHIGQSPRWRLADVNAWIVERARASRDG